MTNTQVTKLLTTVLAAHRSQRIVDARDLHMLVKVALRHEEITVSKAAELLGLPIEDMRAVARGWVTGQADRVGGCHCADGGPGSYEGRCGIARSMATRPTAPARGSDDGRDVDRNKSGHGADEGR